MVECICYEGSRWVTAKLKNLLEEALISDGTQRMLRSYTYL